MQRFTRVDSRPRRLLSAGTGVGLACVFAAGAALAGDPEYTVTILLKEGDALPGGGTAGLPNDVSVNNHGDWIIDTSVSAGPVNRLLLRNGSVWMQPGDPIAPSDTVSSVANALKHINGNGDVSFRPGLTNNTAGVYLNFTPVLLQPGVVNAPQVPVDTPIAGIFRSRMTDDNAVLVLATLNDTSTTGTTNRALIWLTQDGMGGWTADVPFKQHQQAPGAEAGVTLGQINANASDWTINNNGDVIFTVPFLNDSSSATNGGLYINDNLIVRKGDASPISGSDYNAIGTGTTRVGLNNAGDYIFSGTLSNQAVGANNVLVRNNMFTDGPDEVVIKQGDIAPDLDGVRTIDSLGGVQAYVTDASDVVFYSRFTGDSATNQGLYLNDQLILQKGVTIIDGLTLDAVCGTTSTSNGIANSLMVSPNGRYIILRARFTNGQRATLLVEFDEPEPKCRFADLDCNGVVNGFDLLILLAAWGECRDPQNCPADLDGDGFVNGFDLLILLANWG